MNIYHYFETEISSILNGLVAAGTLPADLDHAGISCETPRDPSHGDLATNAAMVLAKRAGMKPRDLAEAISTGLSAVEGVAAVDIAGPGFINLKLEKRLWQDRIDDILAAGENWGKSDIGKGKTVNVEYVSANPTGPLHAAHARGAIIGDSLAALLEWAKYSHREYYINDAGNQVIRWPGRRICGIAKHLAKKSARSPSFYPGDYLKDVGQAFAAAHVMPGVTSRKQNGCLLSGHSPSMP